MKYRCTTANIRLYDYIEQVFDEIILDTNLAILVDVDEVTARLPYDFDLWAIKVKAIESKSSITLTFGPSNYLRSPVFSHVHATL